GGWSTAALGLALHFLIAITTAVVYYLVALRWPLLWRQPLLCGTIYALLVYGVINYIVLPMSAAGSGSKDPLWIGLSILVHMFLIGVPCAVFARRAPFAAIFGTAAANPIISAGHHGQPWQEQLAAAGFLSVAIVIIASVVLILWGLRARVAQHE